MRYMIEKKCRRGIKGQSIIIAMIAIIFMAGIGFAMILWFRSSTRQTAQKEKLATAEDYGKAGVDRAMYHLSKEMPTYTWGNLATPWVSTMTMADGTNVHVEMKEVGVMGTP